MKFFHLADLHIGKKVNQVAMLDEQKHVLAQIIQAIEEHKPDALVLAGDIYDRRNPSIEAIDLLDAFLYEVVIGCGVQVIAIGGNHDSGERLGFASGILEKAGLHVQGVLTLPVRQVRCQDEGGEVVFHLLPYADLATLYHLDPALKGLDYSQAMEKVVDGIVLETEVRHVLVSHGVASLAQDTLDKSDSERELSIGGTDFWTSQKLSAFNYVALGHLHRQQRAGAEHIRYAGSLLKYSFSEENNDKSMTCISLKQDGQIDRELIFLKPLHDMRTIRGSIDQLIEEPSPSENNEDYLRVVLEDEGEVLDAMARLRKVYPNIMVLERANLPMSILKHKDGFLKKEERTPYFQFKSFYEWMAGQPPSDEVEQLMMDVVQTVEEGMA